VPAFFLVLGHSSSGIWMPFIIIPMVLFGIAASAGLFLSGIKGLIACKRRENGVDRTSRSPAKLPLILQPERAKPRSKRFDGIKAWDA
jgi:hypothetical protein